MNKRGLVNHSFEGDNKNRLPSFLRFSVGCARAVQWAAEAVAMGLRRQKILEKTKRTKIYLDVFHYGRLALSLLLLPLVMECYLSRRAPKAKQSWDGDCNDLSLLTSLSPSLSLLSLRRTTMKAVRQGRNMSHLVYMYA